MFLTAIAFGYLLWIEPTITTPPTWASSATGIPVAFGVLSFAIMILTWLSSLAKKDRSRYKPIWGFKTSHILGVGAVSVFFTLAELSGISAKLKAEEYASTRPTGNTFNSSETVLPSIVPAASPDSMKTRVLPTAKPTQKPLVITSPPPRFIAPTATKPCQLSFGTYDLTPTDCVRFKQSDQQSQALQNSIKNLPSYEEIVEQNTSVIDVPSSTADYTHQNQNCKADVQDSFNDEVLAIESAARGSGSSGSDTAYKISQAESKASVAVATCDQLYPTN